MARAPKDKKRGEIIPFMTPPGITMYPWVFEPNPEEDDQGKIWHGLVLRFPKDEVGPGCKYEDDFNEMRKSFTAAAKQGIELGVYSFVDEDGSPSKSLKDKPAEFGNPLRDGDKFDRANNKKRKDELRGCYYINIKSEDAPEVVDANKGLAPIVSKKDFYPGAIAVASGVCGPYENKGNEGVYVRLTNVCKIADGERTGGKPAAKGQFEKYAKGAPKRNAAEEDGDELL